MKEYDGEKHKPGTKARLEKAGAAERWSHLEDGQDQKEAE